MKKIFILDTNVLIHDVDCMNVFADNDVIIPITVIEELDNFKTESNERGKNARLVSRALDSFRTLGKLSEGVELEGGGLLKIDLGHEVLLPKFVQVNKTDNVILNTAYYYQQKNRKVIVVSKDTNLRLKSEALGIESQDYTRGKVNYDELYSGILELEVDAKQIDELYAKKEIQLTEDVFPNQFVILKNNNGSSNSAVGIVSNDNKKILQLLPQKEPILWGIKPLNKEQRFAMELLQNDDLDLVTLVGAAGTGKTLISVATGLARTIDENVYTRLIICRSTVPVGRDIGFLPGDKDEKLDVWMGAIYDNMEFLSDKKHPNEGEERTKYIMDSGKVEIASLTHIRGRTLPHQYIIVDDAQNLTPHEMKTVLSRAGQNTKVVVTGDPHQIDTPYLDSESNGLSYVVDRFKGQENYGHIKFSKTERSRLAAKVAELL